MHTYAVPLNKMQPFTYAQNNGNDRQRMLGN